MFNTFVSPLVTSHMPKSGTDQYEPDFPVELLVGFLTLTQERLGPTP